MHVIRILKGKEKDNSAEKYFEDIMAEDFPNLINDFNP